jgi:hypothetical protein
MTVKAANLIDVTLLPHASTWDNSFANSLALGCQVCPDFGICGGLHTAEGAFDCGMRCTCKNPSACDQVCRKNPVRFAAHVREVGGFSLANVKRAPILPVPALPIAVPVIDHGSKRIGVLDEGYVAIPLIRLFNKGTGVLRFRNREELCKHFRIRSDAVIVATGVARDHEIEPWWRFASPEFLANFAALGLDFYSVPNFSVLTAAPRTENLHAIKRIGLAWAAMVNAGLPTALHINARTDRDYENWCAFIIERPEVLSVAFEFGTGAGYEGRIDWHINHLCNVAETVGRPLTLVLRGGLRRLRELQAKFSRVIYLDTNPFARMRQRCRAVVKAERLTWPAAGVEFHGGKPLDALLAHNIELSRRFIIDPPEPIQHSRVVRDARGLRKTTENTDGKPWQFSLLGEAETSSDQGPIAA